MTDNFTITMGLDTGKTVTVHDTQMSFNGWKGTGYTILDPVSGAGAYMIGGGLDGRMAFGLGLATSSLIAAGIAGIFGISGITFGLATLAPFLLGILGPLLIYSIQFKVVTADIAE